MNIGTLTIEIAAGVARLQKDMDESKRVVAGAMKDIETYVGYAKTAMVALTGVAGAGAFVHMVQGAIEAKAKLYDLSVITGMTVESISALDRVAIYSGTALESVTTASTKLSKALYTTNEDSRGAAAGLKALGLDFETFKQMQPEEQMRQVALQMDKFADGTGKAATAQLLFGKAGADLLPFLKELAERQDLVGVTTTASAKAAKDYQDNLITLRRAGDDWKNQLAADILPALVSVTNELVDGKAAFGGWAGALKDSFKQFVSGSDVKSIGDRLSETRAELGALNADLERAQSKASSTSPYAIGSATAKADVSRLTEEIALLKQRETFLKLQQQRQALALGEGVTDRFDRPKPNLDVPPPVVPDKNKGLSSYEELIRQINEKVAADQAEIESTKKLTEVQQLQLRIINDIDSGKRKLTVAEMVAVDAKLQEALATEKANEARKAELKWLQDTAAENDKRVEQQQRRLAGYQDEAAALRLTLQEYGLTREQVEALNQARLLEAAAALEQKAVWAEQSGFLEEQAQLYRDQAQALRDAAGLRKRLSDLERADRQDPTRGADRAIKDYLEHIKNAGDETYRAVGDALQGLEDMGTRVLMGGKANARAWAEAWISEVLRMRVIRPLLQDIFGAAGGGLGGVIGGLFGGGGLTVDPGGFGIGGGNQPLADLGLGARDVVLPSAGPLAAGGGGRGTLSITFAPVTQIDARSDQAQIAQIADSTSRRHSAELVEMLHSRLGVV